MSDKRGVLAEFKEFVASGSMIELAVAVILASFVAVLIERFTNGVVLNLVAAIVGKPNFDEVARVKVRDASATDPATYLEFGQVITAAFVLVIVGLVLFVVIKAYNKLNKPVEAASGPSEIDLLTEIRDELRNRG